MANAASHWPSSTWLSSFSRCASCAPSLAASGEITMPCAAACRCCCRASRSAFVSLAPLDFFFFFAGTKSIAGDDASEGDESASSITSLGRSII